jgi:uncharacterized protein YjhX (UPF0386 family)
MDFDTEVKLSLYRSIAETARIPSAEEVAKAAMASIEDVLSVFERLQQKRLLVSEPGDPGRIRMAPPFSGIKTSFLVAVAGKSYYANCVWDALGIPAALHQDGIVHGSDGHTGEPILLEVQDGKPVSVECHPMKWPQSLHKSA